MKLFPLIVLGLLIAGPPVCSADDGEQAQSSAAQESRPSIGELIPRQPGDDEVLPFEPKSGSTESDPASADALAWFMAGQVKERRNDLPGAVESYQKAIEISPKELPPYQELVTITFLQLRRQDEAKKYALQAAEQAEGGINLARGLAALFARENTSREAVGLLEQVLALESAEPSRVEQLLLHRDLALFSRLSGDSEKAFENYRTVFTALQEQDSPLTSDQRKEVLGDAGATYEEMGKVFLEAKQPDLAVAAFEEAAKFNKAGRGVHSFNLATVYKETGEPQKALDNLQEYFDAQLTSKGREAYQLLKELLEETGQSDELLPRLEEMHQADSRNEALSYFLAEMYQEQNQLEKAEKLLKEALGQGSDPRGLVGLAGVYRRKKDAEPLFETLKKAYRNQVLAIIVADQDEEELLARMDSDMRAVVEQFRDVHQEIAEDQPVMEGLLAVGRDRKAADDDRFEFLDAFMLARLSAAGEMIDDAKEFFQTAIDMQNNPSPALFRELGFLLTDAERYKEAAEVFTTALAHPSRQLQSPGIRSVFLYFNSHALEMDGQTDKALAAIREARQAQPGNIGYHFQEAWVRYHAHQWDEAITVFEEIINTYDSQTDEETQRQVRNCRYTLSAIYVQQGDEKQGEEVLMQVYRRTPEDIQVNNDLGYLWADQGRKLEQAKTMIGKALAAEPENAAYLDSMGWVLYKLGDYEAARKHLQQASSLPRGEDSTIFDHLGDVYDKLGEKEKALEAWRKALELEEADSHPDQTILDRIKAKLPAE